MENQNTEIRIDWHALSAAQALDRLASTPAGLVTGEAARRLERYGLNRLPAARIPGLPAVFIRQFLNPFVYVLLIAAVISLAIGELADAVFIIAVLLLNAIIGSSQEYSAQKAAIALHRMVTTHSRVVRGGDIHEVDAEGLAPGDIVLLEPGAKVPADLRLLASQDLELDESMLTGESLPVGKDPAVILPADTTLADRANMAFAGTLVARGHGRGLVTTTGLRTELGKIAAEVSREKTTRAPLLERMIGFTYRVGGIMLAAILIMAIVGFFRDLPLDQLFLTAVALAVAAIPEGLPIALTIALAVAMKRMARHNVIVRRLVAVEALGSCTYIATDKTGTLTLNQLTARHVLFPDGASVDLGSRAAGAAGNEGVTARLRQICLAAVLPNEAFLSRLDDVWEHHGDPVDVALLVMARDLGLTRAQALEDLPEIGMIPFESERLFAASFHRDGSGRTRVYVKGALERVLPMCTTMAGERDDMPLETENITARSLRLANKGYRTLAFACGEIGISATGGFMEDHLRDLTFLGIVAMIDPLRPEAEGAVAACRAAGIEVAMVTGDHPATAYAIGCELGLIRRMDEVITGLQLKGAASESEFDALTRRAHVFARVEPRQKLDIVSSLQRNGHFVAVSGDGANDAPALQKAQVGVAMGKKGTDVARETAELVITDDNFASIVSGVEQGRIAYANVRKVVFFLISNGMAEIMLFILAMSAGVPLPLLPSQLIWLNLITCGIQDVALAFEPGQGDELRRPPRPPDEPIFNRLMLERVILTSISTGLLAFGVFLWFYENGATLDQARNNTLLLMVLFENINAFNSRSETLSVFKQNLLDNPLLLAGTVIAHLIHLGALHTPGLSDVLRGQPVTPLLWTGLLLTALPILLLNEIYKAVRTRFAPAPVVFNARS
jgi:calcium-translocating P-type ATPase